MTRNLGLKGGAPGGALGIMVGPNTGSPNDADSDDLEIRDQVQQGVADTVWKVGCYKIKYTQKI